MLTGEAKVEEAVYRHPGLDADILMGDKSSINAADLFSSDAFGAFVAAMRERYDMVIIDTPPVLVVPDARIIARAADAVLFTVRWDRTSRPQVEDALRLFESVGQKVTGLILSQISPSGMKRYGYGGKYGSYSAYGSRYYTN